jgi:type IV pilus assembly protein PilO
MTKKMQQNLIFLVLIFAGLIYVYSKYMIGPLNTKYKTTQQTLAQTEQKLSDMKRRALELPRLQAEMKYLEEEVQGLEKLLPRDKEIPQLIRMITKTAQRFNISVKNIAPAGMVSMSNYDEYPFQIALKGTYHSLARFLTELAQDERILNFRDLTFTGKPPSKEDPDTINVNFTLVAFTFKG